jgi:hypothetical protein
MYMCTTLLFMMRMKLVTRGGGGGAEWFFLLLWEVTKFEKIIRQLSAVLKVARFFLVQFTKKEKIYQITITYMYYSKPSNYTK